MGHPYWPLFDLVVTTPRLTLRYPDDELLIELVAVAARGIHDPATMPFGIPWTDLESPEFEREALKFHWRSKAEVSPTNWRIPLVVIVDGEVVGASDIVTADYAVLRSFETGSWLGREFQGQGIGKEMRLATLTLGFDGFGAVEATTGAWADNARSLGVTTSLGYTYRGVRRAVRRDRPDDQVSYAMDRDHFATLRRDDIVVDGAADCFDLLGIPADRLG